MRVEERVGVLGARVRGPAQRQLAVLAGVREGRVL